MTIRVIGTILIGTAAERAAINPEQFRGLFYETDTEVIKLSNLAGNAWVDISAGAGLYESVYVAWDEKATTVHGGTFTQGAWRTRDLNQESDPHGIGAIAANQVTLDAGTYTVMASAPAYDVARHQMRLYNVTDAALLVTGSNGYISTSDDVLVPATLSGRFTVGAAKAIELQHQCQITKLNFGFGLASNFGGVEIYAWITFWKEA